MKRKINQFEKNERGVFIIQSVFFILLAIPFIVLSFVSLERDYLPEGELVYEECTFVKYEFIKEKHAKGRFTKYYYIYVEEYGRPLRVDSIIYDLVDESKLSGLKTGDKLTVSVNKADGSLDLYSVTCDCSDILSYEDYLAGHEENYKYGLIGFPVLSCIGLGLFVANVIYYKKKGRCMPLR